MCRLRASLRRHPAAAECIGNKTNTAGEELERHPHRARVDVLPVADQLCDDVFTFAARADWTGLAVVDAGHGVIQVRQVRRTRVKDRAGFFVGAVAVRDGDGAAPLPHPRCGEDPRRRHKAV